MKKILALLMLVSSLAYGQQTNGTWTIFSGGLGATKFLNIPNGSTFPTSNILPGSLFFKTTSPMGYYYYDGTTWQIIAVGGSVVTSFNGRTGAVTPIIGDYSSFFVTQTTDQTTGLSGNKTWDGFHTFSKFLHVTTPSGTGAQFTTTDATAPPLALIQSGAGDIQTWSQGASLKATMSNAGNLTTNAFIKTGGTSSQFLKADGSVDGTAYGTGTVTSVAALTLGTIGTDLTSSVANGTTTPVITLNVPTASASNRGALSSTDWTTFNNKAPGTGGTGYIQNQNTSAQATSNYWISGDGTVQGRIYLDAAKRTSIFYNAADGDGTVNINFSDFQQVVRLNKGFIYMDVQSNSNFSMDQFGFEIRSNVGARLRGYQGAPASLQSSQGIDLYMDVTNPTFSGNLFHANTANRRYTFPDVSGTVALVGSTVSSITGTANQIIASASTGAVTLSTPQDIATSSSVQFGKIGIGTAPLSAAIAGIGGNMNTGGGGIGVNAAVPSGASNAYYFGSFAATAVGSYTVTDLYHFSAHQGTFGAGSTITNQYGFYTDNSLTGATNNYSFYGGMASGANRWNLYMSGSAVNYLSGNLQLGSSTAFSGAEKLQVTGTARVIGNIFTLSPASSSAIIAITRPTTSSLGVIVWNQASGSGSSVNWSMGLNSGVNSAFILQGPGHATFSVDTANVATNFFTDLILSSTSTDDIFHQFKRGTNGIVAATKFTTNTTDDWLVGELNGVTSDYHIYSYGTAADAITVARSTGNVTLAGALSAPSGTFSGVITSTMASGNTILANSSAGTGFLGINLSNNTNTGQMFAGVESTTPATIFTGSLAQAALFGTSYNKATQLAANGAVGLTLLGSGNVGIGTSTAPSQLTVNGLINMKNYTVSTLPAGTQGDIAYVTDALTPGFLVIVVGGGSTKTPVFFNGSSWVVF